MSNSDFGNLKNIFLDGGEFDYIDLDKASVAYEKLVQTIDKPLKLILFYGKPGTGKTFLLQKIYNDFKKSKNIIFFPRPFFNEKEFLKALFEEIYSRRAPDIDGYNHFLSMYQNKEVVTVMLDEAQLYPDDLIEKIRLMADSRKFKFLFTVHKTEKEDVLAKDYFKTRIWESIELKNSSLNEVQVYIEKKLLYHNRFEYLTLFQKRHYKLITNLTEGNLRTINKLLYKLFEILEYYDKNQPSKLNSKHLNIKYIEMAAISLGMLDA